MSLSALRGAFERILRYDPDVDDAGFYGGGESFFVFLQLPAQLYGSSAGAFDSGFGFALQPRSDGQFLFGCAQLRSLAWLSLVFAASNLFWYCDCQSPSQPLYDRPGRPV